MISFEYTARDSSNSKPVKGTVEAENKTSAGRLLIQQGLTPTNIEEKDTGFKSISFFGDRVSTKSRIVFTRQLATLINAGLPLAQGLRTVAEQTESKALRKIIDKIISGVEGGSTLSSTFAKYPKVFDDTYIAMVAAGEVSGTLDEALERVATQQEKNAEIIRKIRGALIYPSIVLVVIAGIVVFMMTSVVPQVKQLYVDLAKPLPFLTAWMVKLSDMLIKYWYIALIALVITVILASRYSKTPNGKAVFDKFKMKVPLFGGMFMKMYMARLCRTGETLMKAGVPILDMLNVTARAVDNTHIANDIHEASKKVQAGKALSDALAVSPNILSLVPQMINIGEKSGSIDTMMDKAASYYEAELDEAIRTISASIEPILMVFLALIAGLMVGAVLLPVYSLVGQNLAL